MYPCEVNGKVVIVLAFKTAYTLEQRRRDNDKKIISLFVGMKDMMGANSEVVINLMMETRQSEKIKGALSLQDERKERVGEAS